MTDKKKADQQASPKKTRIDNTSSEAQRKRLLEHMHLHGFITTMAARRDLDVMHPAARIQELRGKGHPIKTHLITLTDDHGRTHHGVALYYLGTMPELELIV